MPNIATALREEITRLSRRESRSQIDPTRKATARHRSDIAALKRQVTQLERQVALLSRKTRGAPPATAADSPAKPARFTAKSLRSQRNRLGLSAGDFGKLLGMSAQSVYNWELEKSHPRAEQIAKLAALRGIGKREAVQQLANLGSGKKAPGRKT